MVNGPKGDPLLTKSKKDLVGRNSPRFLNNNDDMNQVSPSENLKINKKRFSDVGFDDNSIQVDETGEEPI